ncbi:MAG: LysM peptidoglycan-binding domain-containing protein [bacterium]
MKRFLGLLLLSLLLVGVTGCPKRPLVPPVDQARLDAEDAIASAGKAIKAAQAVGADTAIAESVLDEAQRAFDDGDYATATHRAWNAESLANEARAREEALAKAREEAEWEVDQARLDAEDAIASAGKAIKAAQAVGADTAIAESVLDEAQRAFDDGDYATATHRAWNAESLANEARAREEALARAREEAPKVYVVGTWEKDRDCLWNIAKKESIYGDPWKWKRIYEANRDKIVDPDLIYPGQRLIIP